LASLLRAHNLVWADSGAFSAVRVERLAREINGPEIAASVAAFLSHQSGRSLEARITPFPLTLRAPVTSTGGPDVEILAFDGRSGAFDAVVRVPGGDSARISGVAEEVMDIPVLTRPVQHGETIGEADVTTMHVRIVYLSRNTITDPKNLIGLSA